MTGLSFCWPLAYDWRRGCEAMARLWKFGDEHVIAWDLGGRTWAGAKFETPKAQPIALALVGQGVPPEQVNARMRLVIGEFCPPWGDVEERETAERNALSFLCKPRNWCVQVDADEEWCNPEEAVEWLRAYTLPSPFAATGKWLQVAKVIGDVALVQRRQFHVAFAMGSPGIWTCPRGLSDKVSSPLRWVNWWLCGRSDAELRLKLPAMGYAKHVDPEAAIDAYRALSLENYRNWPGIGQYNDPLVPMSLTDLRAGKWPTNWGVP